MEQGNIYFASDFHLGAGTLDESRQRELRIVRWLNSVAANAKAIYLVGDVFDFWFEYKWSIPKGYVRLFGTIAKLIDSGIEIHFLKGNHDMWVYDYFTDEIGMIVHEEEVKAIYNEKKFYIAHGDGLGKGEPAYKFVRKVLRSRRLQKMYARMHPSWGLRLMRKMSAKSRSHNQLEEKVHAIPIAFAEQYLENEYIDYFIMGHRHEVINHLLSNNKSRYVNLGDWVSQNTFALWDGEKLELQQFRK